MIIYIADFNLPNSSAYSHQVLKMCDAFCKNRKKLRLYLKSINKEYTFNKIKNEHLLKNKFEIHPVVNKKKIIFF